jgi:hypothetical protein
MKLPTKLMTYAKTSVVTNALVATGTMTSSSKAQLFVTGVTDPTTESSDQRFKMQTRRK